MACFFFFYFQTSSGDSSGKLEKPSSTQRAEEGERKQDKIGDQFAINPALVPSYIPLRVIEKVNIKNVSGYSSRTFMSCWLQILFVGEAVKIFQRKSDGGAGLSTTLTGAGELEVDLSFANII